MTTDEIAELLALVRAELEQPYACPEDLWREPCEWDSTTLVNIIFVAEERVHITLTAEQMDCVRGLRSLIAMIDDAARLVRTPA
jgi:acyl carrier protein